MEKRRGGMVIRKKYGRHKGGRKEKIKGKLEVERVETRVKAQNGKGETFI